MPKVAKRIKKSGPDAAAAVVTKVTKKIGKAEVKGKKVKKVGGY